METNWRKILLFWALADESALSYGRTLEENFEYSSICAESFNPSANYKITLNSLGGMSIEEGHYLRSDSMSKKFPKTKPMKNMEYIIFVS